MARPPKGKPLTFRPLRLDDDVWAECQRLGKVHGTINEGIAAAFALQLDDDVWEAVKAMPCSLNQYLRGLLVSGKVDTDVQSVLPDKEVQPPPSADLRKPRPKVGPAFKGQLLRPGEKKGSKTR